MADFAAQREKSEEQRQERLKKKRSSSSSTTLSARQIRTRELQSQGLSTTEASQISLAESTGQKLTNIQTLSPEAQRIIRGSGLEATRSGSSRTSTTQTTSTSTTDKPTLQQQIREGREARVERQRSLAEQEAQKRFFDINTQTLFPDEPGRKRKVERPIFTEGTGRRLAGEELTLVEAPKRKVFKEEGTGLTIGVEDEISGQSFRTTTTEKRLQEEAIERALEEQYKIVEARKPTSKKTRFADINEKLLFPDEPDKTRPLTLLTPATKRQKEFLDIKTQTMFPDEPVKRTELNNLNVFDVKTQKLFPSDNRLLGGLNFTPFRQEENKFIDLFQKSFTPQGEKLKEFQSLSGKQQALVIGGAGVGLTAIAFPAASINIAKTTAFGLGTQQLVMFGGKQTLSKEEKAVLRNPLFQEAFTEAREKTRAELISEQPVLGRVKSFLPTGLEFSTKDAFQSNLRESLQARQYAGDELNKALRAGRSKSAFSAAGELSALLAAGAATERIGSIEFSKLDLKQTTRGVRVIGAGEKRTTKKIASEAVEAALKSEGKVDITKIIAARSKEVLKPTILTPFKGAASRFRTKATAFKIIAPLGVGEGLTESISSDIAREKPIDFTKAIISGGIGGITAGTIGASLVTAQGGKRTALATFANIADPTELPGDIISNVPGRIESKFIKTISVNPVFAASSILSTDIATPSPSVFTPDFKPRVRSPSFSFTPTKTFDPDIKIPSIGIPKTKPQSFAKTFSITDSLQGIDSYTRTSSKSNTVNDVLNQITSAVDSNSISTSVSTSVSSSVSSTVSAATTVPTTVATTVPTAVSTFVGVPTTVSVPVFVTDSLKLKKPRKKTGFNTQVKVKGKWKNINKKPQTEATAFDLANYVVDNSTARSFRVTKSKKKGKLSTKDYPGSFNPLNYRKKGNTYIEPASRAINSPGELQGITALGLLTKKKKKAQKDIFRIGF